MLLTFADLGEPRPLAVIKALQVPYRKYFKFNNYVRNKDAGEMHDSEDESEDDVFDKMLWNMGSKNFKEFMVELNKLQQISVKQTQEVLDKTFSLETTIKNLETNIDIGHAVIHKLVKLETDTNYEYQTG